MPEQKGELVTVEAGPDGDLAVGVLAALDERPTVAALPQVGRTDGRLVDLERVGAPCRVLGTALVFDRTRPSGAVPLDLGRVRPAFAVAETRKRLLDPCGVFDRELSARLETVGFRPCPKGCAGRISRACD